MGIVLFRVAVGTQQHTRLEFFHNSLKLAIRHAAHIQAVIFLSGMVEGERSQIFVISTSAAFAAKHFYELQFSAYSTRSLGRIVALMMIIFAFV